jgi:cytosine/adenosine deaminase-related metal-dependent hydrolase
MATRGGARALNLEADVGALEPGKKADIITLDLSRNTRLFPLTAQTVVSIITDNGCGADVADVMVDGKMLMRDRELLHLNERAILARAEKWHREFIHWYQDKLAKEEPFVERLHPDFQR